MPKNEFIVHTVVQHGWEPASSTNSNSSIHFTGQTVYECTANSFTAFRHQDMYQTTVWSYLWLHITKKKPNMAWVPRCCRISLYSDTSAVRFDGCLRLVVRIIHKHFLFILDQSCASPSWLDQGWEWVRVDFDNNVVYKMYQSDQNHQCGCF